MATMKKFKVTLHEASKTRWGGICTKLDIGGKESPSLSFEATSTADVIRMVEAFAAEHGKPCNAWVRCLSKPKPNGFDKATTHLYYNMDKAEIEA